MEVEQGLVIPAAVIAGGDGGGVVGLDLIRCRLTGQKEGPGQPRQLELVDPARQFGDILVFQPVGGIQGAAADHVQVPAGKQLKHRHQARLEHQPTGRVGRLDGQADIAAGPVAQRQDVSVPQTYRQVAFQMLRNQRNDCARGA